MYVELGVACVTVVRHTKSIKNWPHGYHVLYNENNSGAKMDPWGTPQLRWAAEDEWTPKLMEKLLFDREDWNHLWCQKKVPGEIK